MILPIVLALTFAFSPSLRGSHASQARQNTMANRLKLERYCNRNELEKAIAVHKLVLITDGPAYTLDKDIGSADPGHEALYRHSRPWVKTFLDQELGSAHKVTGAEFLITSLVRTDDYQRHLGRRNCNAIRGRAWWKRSSHVTGSTVDISWLGLDPKARAWLRKRLLELERRGLVEATMEHHNACFHVMVFPAYAKARP